jgi:hypothetical protein
VRDDPKGPLFRTIPHRGGLLTRTPNAPRPTPAPWRDRGQGLNRTNERKTKKGDAEDCGPLEITHQSSFWRPLTGEHPSLPGMKLGDRSATLYHQMLSSWVGERFEPIKLLA